MLVLQKAEPPPDVDGDPLLLYLDDPEHPWKDLAVSEYYGHNVRTGIAMIPAARGSTSTPPAPTRRTSPNASCSTRRRTRSN